MKPCPEFGAIYRPVQYRNLNPRKEKTVVEFFDRSVNDADFVCDIVKFLSMYCIYAAPKEEMMKEVKAAQLALYF